MTDEPTTRAVPDTGFKLQPTISRVLADDGCGTLDELALRILDAIPTYDRETALFQAIKRLAQPMFQPRVPPRLERSKVTSPSTTSPAPRETARRDGRQWLHDDGRLADTPIQRSSLPRGEGSVTPLHPEQPAPRKPGTSKTVDAIRAMYQQHRENLQKHIAVGADGVRRPVADFSLADLQYAVEYRRSQAAGMLSNADWFEAHLVACRTHGARTPGGLPDQVLVGLAQKYGRPAA